MRSLRSRRGLVKLVGATALAVSGLAIFPVTAGALPIDIYGNSNYLGESGSIAGSNYWWGALPGTGCANESGNGVDPVGWNDCVSSLKNTYADRGVFFYLNTNCNVNNDPYLYVPAATNEINLQNNSFNPGNADANDAISSDNTSGSNTNCTGVGD